MWVFYEWRRFHVLCVWKKLYSPMMGSTWDYIVFWRKRWEMLILIWHLSVFKTDDNVLFAEEISLIIWLIELMKLYWWMCLSNSHAITIYFLFWSLSYSDSIRGSVEKNIGKWLICVLFEASSGMRNVLSIYNSEILNVAWNKRNLIGLENICWFNKDRNSIT